MLRDDAWFYQDSRVAAVDGVRFQVLVADGAGGQHGVGADGDAGADPGARGDPGAVFDCNGPHDQIEGGCFVIVTAGAEKCALRNAHVIANDNTLQIQQPAFLTQPDMVANGQLPRESDIDSGFYGYVAANTRSECVQNCAF